MDKLNYRKLELCCRNASIGERAEEKWDVPSSVSFQESEEQRNFSCYSDFVPFLNAFT